MVQILQGNLNSQLTLKMMPGTSKLCHISLVSEKDILKVSQEIVSADELGRTSKLLNLDEMLKLGIVHEFKSS